MAFRKIVNQIKRRLEKRVQEKRRLLKIRLNDPERHRARQRRRDANRSETYKARKRQWRVAWRRAYLAVPAARLAKNLRDRLHGVLRGRIKTGSSVRLLGCTVHEAVAHLERQFSRRMTWANWGSAWEVDHIRPLAGFELTDPAQLAQACHFTNLQPLPKSANRAKGAKALYLL